MEISPKVVVEVCRKMFERSIDHYLPLSVSPPAPQIRPRR